MKICVYAISKNEALHVKRFCEAAAPADLIFVADTGSTDDTVSLLEDCGATVAHISIKPWRFDDARNAALSLLPEDFDVCVSLDMDEVLQSGWRDEIERVWIEGTTRLRYGFDWGAGIVFKYEKIHARHGYRWHHPCHEYPVADRIDEKWADTDMLLVVHKPDPTKSRGQYLDLLKVSIEEDPQCPRNAFYYARELSFHKQWQDAIDQSKRYLALPRATWPNERCYAMRVIGRCYQELGNFHESLNWFRQACNEAPGTREPWFEVASCCYRMNRWMESFTAAMMCLSITNRELVYTVDPNVWSWQPHDYASIAAFRVGFYQIALEQATIAAELAPDDLRLRQNLVFCQEKVA
jgi:glycosyltransferase involved in cell wall biosynthesis